MQRHQCMSVWLVDALDEQVAPCEVITTTRVWMCVKGWMQNFKRKSTLRGTMTGKVLYTYKEIHFFIIACAWISVNWCIFICFVLFWFVFEPSTTWWCDKQDRCKHSHTYQKHISKSVSQWGWTVGLVLCLFLYVVGVKLLTPPHTCSQSLYLLQYINPRMYVKLLTTPKCSLRYVICK